MDFLNAMTDPVRAHGVWRSGPGKPCGSFEYTAKCQTAKRASVIGILIHKLRGTIARNLRSSISWIIYIVEAIESFDQLLHSIRWNLFNAKEHR